jgi:16S rRNA processing protein RimM
VESVETIEVVVGRVGKPHGLRGEVTVELRTDEPERRFGPGASVRAERPAGAPSPWPALTVTATRWHQSTLLVRFDELPDRTAAESARGLLLHADVPVDESPDDPDEYYDHQLVGLAVHDVRGDPRGVVSEVLHLPGQDLLAVVDPEEHERLVPFVRDLVTAVDLDRRVLVVDDPPGLLGDEPTADTDEGGLDAD